MTGEDLLKIENRATEDVSQNFGPQSSLEGSDREEASPKVKWDGWSSFALRSCHDSSQGPARYIPQLEVRS